MNSSKIKCFILSDYPTVEIKQSATTEFQTSQSLFYFISDGYKSGSEIEAQKVDCSLKFGKQGTNEQMQFIFQEFAPFYNGTDYCLQVEGSTKMPYCTGQKSPIPYYGIFESTTGWDFTLQVYRNDSFRPPVRFWMILHGIVHTLRAGFT